MSVDCVYVFVQKAGVGWVLMSPLFFLSLLGTGLIFNATENVTASNETSLILGNETDSDLILVDLDSISGEDKSLLSKLFENLFSSNSSSTTWIFVSFITVTPIMSCSEIDSIVSMYDKAMASTNPDANIVSTARRLGTLPCSGGTCPCTSRRSMTTRVLELQSRSRSKRISYPLFDEFPLDVKISTQ